MGMLSNVEITEVIEKDLLKIEPFEPRMLKPSCIRLRLGHNILVQQKKGIIDPYDEKTMDCYKKLQIDEKNPYVLRPNALILAHTFEKVGISNSLGVLLDGTSTMSRFGITITQTSMIIDTGHGWPKTRDITIEIVNHGLNPVKLHYKMRIARMAIFRLERKASFAYDEKGKYSDGSIAPKKVSK